MYRIWDVQQAGLGPGGIRESGTPIFVRHFPLAKNPRGLDLTCWWPEFSSPDRFRCQMKKRGHRHGGVYSNDNDSILWVYNIYMYIYVYYIYIELWDRYTVNCWDWRYDTQFTDIMDFKFDNLGDWPHLPGIYGSPTPIAFHSVFGSTSYCSWLTNIEKTWNLIARIKEFKTKHPNMMYKNVRN